MSTDPFPIDGVKILLPDQHEPAPYSSTIPNNYPAGTHAPLQSDSVVLSSSRQVELVHKGEEYAGAAGAIRSADQALKTLGQKIGAMKVPLQAIVKNYPPFAPGDETRARYLRQYAALRKEIDALTVPRPDDAGAPAKPSAPLPPVLPGDATDSQITDHLGHLDAAGTDFARLRAAIAAHAAAIAEDGRYFAADLRAPGAQELTEAAARKKSSEVGQQFANTIGQGVVTSKSQFLRSLG